MQQNKTTWRTLSETFTFSLKQYQYLNLLGFHHSFLLNFYFVVPILSSSCFKRMIEKRESSYSIAHVALAIICCPIEDGEVITDEHGVYRIGAWHSWCV